MMPRLSNTGTFHERKAERTAVFEREVRGWRLVTCSACNGSGHYDARNSPACSGCNGTGRARVSPADYAVRAGRTA